MSDISAYGYFRLYNKNHIAVGILKIINKDLCYYILHKDIYKQPIPTTLKQIKKKYKLSPMIL